LTGRFDDGPAGDLQTVVTIIAIDGRSGPSEERRVLGRVDTDAPVGQGDELTLPGGSRVVVMDVVDRIEGPRWTQVVAVVDDWIDDG
jgi:hypothetical protein